MATASTKTPKKNLYQALGLEPSATAKEIQKAHNSLLKMYHPQINKAPSALVKYMAIEKAYKVLSDSKAKAEYDTKNFGAQNKPSVSVSEPKKAPVKSEPKVKKAKAETLVKAEEPKTEVVTKSEEPKSKKAKTEEPKAEKVEEIKPEETKEQPKPEETKTEDPKVENAEEPKTEAPKPEETKIEEPKAEEQKVKEDTKEKVTEKGKEPVENKGEEKKEIKKDNKIVPINILPRKKGKKADVNKTDLEILKEKQRQKERLKRIGFLLLAILFFLSTIMSVVQVQERSIWSWIFNPSGVIDQGPPDGGDDDDYTQLGTDEQRITINALITFTSYTGTGNIRIYNHRTNIVDQKINLCVRFGADTEGVGPIIYTNPTNIFGTPILLKPDQSITSDRMNALGRSMGGNTAYEVAREYGSSKYLEKYGSVPSGYDIYAVVAEFQAYNSAAKFLGQTNAEIFIFIKI